MNRVLLVAATLCAGVSYLAAQEPPKPPAKPIKLTAGPAAPANPPSQAELTTRRTEKLAKPVFKNAAWVTDYDAAKAQAKKEGKLLLAYFTRSYSH